MRVAPSLEAVGAGEVLLGDVQAARERNLAVDQFAKEELDLDDTDAPGVNGLP